MDIYGLTRFTFRDLMRRQEPVEQTDIYIQAGAKWLEQAIAVTGDGGVSAEYSLVSGWEHSYIETTGYILVTFFSLAKHFGNRTYKRKAIGMADFLLKNQLVDGAFSSGTPQSGIVPRVFNTGEALKGLVVAYRETGDRKYLIAAIRAADWICACQSGDGSWNKHEYMDQGHAYHTRTSHGLLMVWQETKKYKYYAAAGKNLHWVLRRQRKNGWFASCNFDGQLYPFTHAISYTIDGLLECFRTTKTKEYLNAARTCADALLRYYQRNLFMPATFDSRWKSNDSYTCLTGDAQITLNWFDLHDIENDNKYLYAGESLLSYLKTTVSLDNSNPNTHGALAGAYPTYGGYSRWNFPNWATKFFIDACLRSREKYE